MKWRKPSGKIIDAKDNEATEKFLLGIGCVKIGSPPVEIGDPEEGAHDPYNPADPKPDERTDADGQSNPPEAETHEITEDEMPDNLPMCDPEEQSISPDEVGDMPKDILGG